MRVHIALIKSLLKTTFVISTRYLKEKHVNRVADRILLSVYSKISYHCLKRINTLKHNRYINRYYIYTVQ